MKYLALLFGLFVTSAQAETIVMTCKSPTDRDETFRFKSGFWGLTKATYEERLSGRWIRFCEPGEGRDYKFTCEAGDKSMTSHYLAPGKYGTLTYKISKLIDFELKQYHVYFQEENDLRKFSCRTVDSD